MTIEERVAHLETSMRRWRTVCFVLGIALLTALFIGADKLKPQEQRQVTEFDAIRCRGIDIVNKDRNLRITLNGDNGEVMCRQLDVCNEKDFVRASVSGEGIVRSMGWSVDDAQGESIAHVRRNGDESVTLRIGRNKDPFFVIIASKPKACFVGTYCLNKLYGWFGADQASGGVGINNADGSGAVFVPEGVSTKMPAVSEEQGQLKQKQ